MNKKSLVYSFLDERDIRESFESCVNRFYGIGEENQRVSAIRNGGEIFFESVSHYIDVIEIEYIFLCMGSWIFTDEGYEFWSGIYTEWMDFCKDFESEVNPVSVSEDER